MIFTSVFLLKTIEFCRDQNEEVGMFDRETVRFLLQEESLGFKPKR